MPCSWSRCRLRVAPVTQMMPSTRCVSSSSTLCSMRRRPALTEDERPEFLTLVRAPPPSRAGFTPTLLAGSLTRSQLEWGLIAEPVYRLAILYVVLLDNPSRLI